jgi:hypothetical protein
MGPGSGGDQRPDQSLPPGHEHPGQGLPGALHMGDVFIVAYHPQRGLHWVKVSDLNTGGQDLPGGGHASGQPVPGGQPGQGLPGKPPGQAQQPTPTPPVAGTPPGTATQPTPTPQRK